MGIEFENQVSYATADQNFPSSDDEKKKTLIYIGIIIVCVGVMIFGFHSLFSGSSSSTNQKTSKTSFTVLTQTQQ